MLLPSSLAGTVNENRMILNIVLYECKKQSVYNLFVVD